MKNKNWFWGIFFLLAAVFVIGSQVGSFGNIGIISIIATILLIAIMIEGIIERNFFGIFLPIAFLYMLYWHPLHLVAISIWLLILAAVLVSLGFTLIFHPRHRYDKYNWKNWHCDKNEDYLKQSKESLDDNSPYVKTSFNSTIKYLHASNLKNGQFITSFCSLDVYFDQVELDPNGAEIFVDCSFGAIKLFIPRSWNVVDNVRATLGGVENEVRRSEPDSDAPKLVISGEVQFGAIEIKYI